jgi:transposase-like protein
MSAYAGDSLQSTAGRDAVSVNSHARRWTWPKTLRQRFQAQAAARAFCQRWRTAYPRMVRQLQADLPEWLSFFRLPRHLWKKLRTTNIIERSFVEVRRRTRPMVCFANVQSVDRIICSIFQRFNLEWKTRILRVFTQAA